MKTKSIRWRLSLSYAAIALLATLLLGVILLAVLFNYYIGQEIAYLTSNAESIGSFMAYYQEQDDFPQSVLHESLKSFSFISNTQVRLLGIDGQILEDSGLPPEFTTLSLGAFSDEFPAEYSFSIFSTGAIDQLESMIGTVDAPFLQEGQIVIEAVSAVPFSGRIIYPYSNGIEEGEILAENGERSTQVVQFPFYNNDMVLQGYVELSNGPAYGRAIIENVVRAWIIAGSLAVTLSAIAGWMVSRRFSNPLESLTEVSSQMAEGSLTARADISRTDEFGILANSFNHMADSIESKVKALRRFVADAAHELYTPLTAIRANLELSIKGSPKTDQENNIKQAIIQVDRMDELTKGLLDLSQIEVMDISSKLIEVDFGKIVRSLEEIYASRAEQAGISFNTNVEPVSMVTLGDPGQLQTIVQNLLDNAIKFTPGGGKVNLSLHSENNNLVLRVKDTGIGISEKDLPQIFSRFHRGQNTSNFPGSGLGLAIVRAIVERHNGEYFVESGSKGSVFTVHLKT